MSETVVPDIPTPAAPAAIPAKPKKPTVAGAIGKKLTNTTGVDANGVVKTPPAETTTPVTKTSPDIKVPGASGKGTRNFGFEAYSSYHLTDSKLGQGRRPWRDAQGKIHDGREDASSSGNDAHGYDEDTYRNGKAKGLTIDQANKKLYEAYSKVSAEDRKKWEKRGNAEHVRSFREKETLGMKLSPKDIAAKKRSASKANQAEATRIATEGGKNIIGVEEGDIQTK